MATAFDRWEKDPFFFAAEEVQEASDRMESIYRRWMIRAKTPGDGVMNSFATELGRELHTALGTAKWQLEELERAVRSSDRALLAGEATISRHSEFVEAISSKILMVEKDLKKLNLDESGESALAWVRLDEGERDELALFLSCPKGEVEKVLPKPSCCLKEGHGMNGESSVPLNNSSLSTGLNSPEKVEKDHRTIANSFAECSDKQIKFSPPKMLNLTELRAMEAVTKPKWYRNGFRKWKNIINEDMGENLPLHNNHLSRGMNACYEKGKSCLSDCTDEAYNKQLYGWLGTFHRQIQRSQYQIQYRRPIQIIIWTIVTLFLIVLLVLRVG